MILHSHRIDLGGTGSCVSEGSVHSLRSPGFQPWKLGPVAKIGWLKSWQSIPRCIIIDAVLFFVVQDVWLKSRDNLVLIIKNLLGRLLDS